MSEIRLFINYSEIYPGKIVQLSKEDRKYLFTVMRAKAGDNITILNGKGKSFHAKIIDKGVLEVLNESNTTIDTPYNLVLCQSLLKGEKMDFIIQKATEIGVSKIMLFTSERSIVKVTSKLERWKKIAKEAAEQSVRLNVPEIEAVENFDNLLKIVDNGILFWERATQPLIDVFLTLNISKPIFLIIGPEGGFTQKEVQLALNKGIGIASLGRRVIRSDTAAIVSLALISFLCDNHVIIKKNE